MFFDLNVPVPPPALLTIGSGGQISKKGKQKQKEQQASSAPVDNASQCLYSSGQIGAIEARIDLLVHRELLYFELIFH